MIICNQLKFIMFVLVVVLQNIIKLSLSYILFIWFKLLQFSYEISYSFLIVMAKSLPFFISRKYFIMLLNYAYGIKTIFFWLNCWNVPYHWAKIGCLICILNNFLGVWIKHYAYQIVQCLKVNTWAMHAVKSSHLIKFYRTVIKY